MKHAYLISTEYNLKALQLLIEVGYIESVFEITPDIASDIATNSKLAAERIKQLPSYKDGFTGQYENALSYFRNFHQLFHILRYKK